MGAAGVVAAAVAVVVAEVVEEVAVVAEPLAFHCHMRHACWNQINWNGEIYFHKSFKRGAHLKLRDHDFELLHKNSYVKACKNLLFGQLFLFWQEKVRKI